MPPTLKGGQKTAIFLSKLTQAPRSATLSAGIFPEAHYPNGTPVAQSASAQEYGTRTIPARPFMRPTFAEHQTDWATKTQKLLRNAPHASQAVLNQLAPAIISALHTKIDTITTPALAPTTIKQKARYHRPRPQKPLIDTGLMRASLQARIDVSEPPASPPAQIPHK